MKNETFWHRLVWTMAMQMAWTAWIGAPCLAAPQPREAPAPPAIEIQKLTNGVDADSEPGPSIPAGETAMWTYVLTNVGGVTLYDVTVADSSRVGVTCPGTETLEAGEMVTCVAFMVVEPGPYRSQGVVAAATGDGLVVDDSDPTFHVGTVTEKALE